MVKDKFTRHAIAFTGITIASVLLYPTAQANEPMLIWFFIGLVGLAAAITLTTR